MQDPGNKYREIRQIYKQVQKNNTTLHSRWDARSTKPVKKQRQKKKKKKRKHTHTQNKKPTTTKKHQKHTQNNNKNTPKTHTKQKKNTLKTHKYNNRQTYRDARFTRQMQMLMEDLQKNKRTTTTTTHTKKYENLSGCKCYETNTRKHVTTIVMGELRHKH